MLVCKDIVLTAGKATEYDRVYLEYGPNDPVETFGKTHKGEAVKLDGKEWQGTRPKNAVTTHAATELLEQAIQYFAQKYPAQKDAWITSLEAQSYGADLWVRNALQADLKPVDKSAAIEAAAKNLVKAGIAANIEAAREMVTKLMS